MRKMLSRIKRAFRTWHAYHRILRELCSVPDLMLAELGTRRSDIYDFAWDCARLAAAAGAPNENEEQSDRPSMLDRGEKLIEARRGRSRTDRRAKETTDA